MTAAIEELVVEAEQKPLAPRSVLAQHPHESALVFTNFKATVAALEKARRGGGVSASSLHGDLEQFERDKVLATFCNGSTRVLIATDVAARGIDVERLDLVSCPAARSARSRSTTTSRTWRSAPPSARRR